MYAGLEASNRVIKSILDHERLSKTEAESHFSSYLEITGGSNPSA
jgi:hypothetical protein